MSLCSAVAFILTSFDQRLKAVRVWIIYEEISALELPGIHTPSAPRKILFDTVSFDDP